MSTLVEYQLRIRNAADTADAVTITSIRGGTNPYISKTPTGDGSSFDPLTMASVIGEYAGQIADWPIGSMQRVITSQLEDGNGRQQLGYRKAFWERRVNGGAFVALIAGVLTRLQLISGAEWDVAVTDPQRAGIVQQLFSPASTINITDFLTAWPNRGCILGGPVMLPVVGGKPGKIFGIQDLGGWTMRVETTALTGQYFLRPVNVYGPVNNWQSSNTISEDLANAINQAVNQFQSAYNDGGNTPWTTIKDTQTNYWAWPGVVVLIDGVPWKPLPYFYAGAADSNGNPYPPPLVSPVKGSTGSGLHVISDGVRTLTNAALVRVRVLTILPTDTCPIYLADNPIELIKTAWTATNIPFDSSACTTLKADPSIGSNALTAFRITSAEGLSSLISDIQRPYGIGIRANKSGQLVPFQGREMPNTPPTKTITAANVIKGSTRLPFGLDPAKAVQTIQFSEKWFASAVDAMPGASPVDQVRESDVPLTLVNGDTTAVPFGTADLSTNAMLYVASSKTPVFENFAKAKAQPIFSRFGHGAIALETTLIRGTAVGGGFFTDDIVLGEELLMNLPELPNANYRLGDNPAIAARAMQVVQLTEIEEGYAVQMIDSGPNAQPLSTVPTLSIAVSSDSPRTIAEVTITNAAALNALSYGARIQRAATTGGAPSANDFTDVIAFAPGLIPTGVIRLSPADAGTTVYVQARSEGLPGARPSNYGSSAHVTLSAINDPSSVTATPSGTDASLCALAWLIGSGASDCYSDIYLRLSGQTFDKAARVDTVNPGSIAYSLHGLTSGTNYIASVQHRDPRTQDISNAVDVAFTAGGTARTLSAPFFPTGFAGSRDKSFGIPIPTGAYGLAVIAIEVPGFVEFAEALETAVGSGTYGSFVTVASVPSVAGDWTFITRVAPNDGLRRQLKARHVGDGATSSSYTAIATVTPWTSLPLVPFAAAAQGTVSIDSNGAWSATADGQAFVQSWRYATSTSAYPSDATAAGGTTTSGRTFSLSGLGSLTFGQTLFITAIPYTGPSGTGAALPSIHIRGSYQTYTATKTTTYSRVAWRDMSLLGFGTNANNDILNVALTSGTIRNRFGISVLLPVGVTLISAAFDVEWNTAATQQLGLFALAVLQNGTSPINSGSPTYAAGAQTVTVSLGSTVTTTGGILFQNTWGNALGPSTADAGQAILRDVAITYSQPKPDVNV